MANVRTIRCSIGDTDFATGTFLDERGTDLTAVTWQISLGTATAPGTWRAPDKTEQITTSQVRLSLLVGPAGSVNPTAGTYWLWIRDINSPITASVVTGDTLTII